jgi:hypothetical protein
MAMTDMRLYLAIGLPVFAFLVNIAAGIVQTTSLHARMTSVETGLNGRFTSLETSVNARFTSIENRISGLENRFGTMIGKVVEKTAA